MQKATNNPILDIQKVSPKQAREIVLSWYPWWKDDQVSKFLVLKTPWPLVTNAQLKQNLKLMHLRNWDEYIADCKKHGHEPNIDEL